MDTTTNEAVNRTVSFIDADGHRAEVYVEITTRNGYPEFAASGRYLGSFGQCLDFIKPASEAQKELIQLWEKYHLQNVSAIPTFEKTLTRVLNSIEVEEEQRDAMKVQKRGEELILEQMSEYGIDEDKLEACKAYLDVMGSGTDLSDFEEAYAGEFSSDEGFAQEMHDETRNTQENGVWPYTCIDWEQAARELMMDYTESNGYYFRNL